MSHIRWSERRGALHNPNEPVAYERVRTWLLEAEGLAKVPKQDGSLWHAFRRAWATARESHSVKDVAEAGRPHSCTQPCTGAVWVCRRKQLSLRLAATSGGSSAGR